MSDVRGAVYDRGYRPYDGELGGRPAARAALWRLSIRRALGLRRSWRQKVFPWTLLAIATLPAIVNVGVTYVTRESPARDFSIFTYREYVGVSNALLLFVALTAPDVVCPDRRNRVLPLLFARPITGGDYVAAKIGAIASIVFGFGFLPHVVLFVGQTLVGREGALDYMRHNAEVLWQVPIAVALLALFHASVGVALAATVTRRVVGGVAILAFFLVTSTIAGVLVGVVNHGESKWAVLNMVGLPLHVRDLIFLGHVDPGGPLAGVEHAGVLVVAAYVAVVAVALAVLLERYREAEAS
jgi:hypothetical protein